MVNGEQFIFETQEMRVLQGKNQEVRNGHTGRENYYGPRKIKRNSRLASSYDG